MGLFNPKLQETSGSSVTQQSAVQKADVVGGLVNVVQQASSIFAEVGAAKQQAVQASALGGFNQELSLIAESVNQGLITPAAAATAGRSKYAKFVSNNPQLAGEASKAYKGVSDVTGAFDEKESEQQRLTKLVNTKLANEGYLDGTETPTELQQKREDFSTAEMAKAALLSLKAKRAESKAVTKDDKELLDEELKVKSDNATKDYVSGRGAAHNTRINSIYNDIKNGALSPSDGVIQLKQVSAAFRLEVDGSGTESKELANELLKPYEETIATYVELADGKLDATYGENKVKSILAKEKIVLLSDPKNTRVVATSNLLGNPAISVAKVNKVVADMYAMSIKSSNGEGKVPIIAGTPDGDGYLKLIKSATKVIGADDPQGTNKAAITELGALANQHLKSIDVHSASAEGSSEYNSSVEYIASPEFATMVEAGIIDEDMAFNAGQVLARQYTDVLLPLVKEKIKTSFTTHTGTFYDSDIINKGIEEAVNVEITSRGVVFTPKTDIQGVGPDKFIFNEPQYVKLLKDLNATVGKQINKVVRMNAHLSGSTDYKAIAEQSMGRMLSIQPQEELVATPSAPIVTETIAPITVEFLTEQAQTAGVDLSAYEDGDYSDGAKTFTVKGGKIVGVK